MIRHTVNRELNTHRAPGGIRHLWTRYARYALALGLGVLFVASLGHAQPLAAQTGAQQPDAQADTPPATPAATGWMNTPGVTPDEVNTVAEGIWCPLCSGVRLDSCELRACEQMKDVIALKLAQGEDSAAIKEHFLNQYGPQILGEPPRAGFNWLAWILPVVAVAGGGFFLWQQARRLVGPQANDSTPTPAAQQSSTDSGTESGIEPDRAGQTALGNAEQRNAEQRLDEELTRYG